MTVDQLVQDGVQTLKSHGITIDTRETFATHSYGLPWKRNSFSLTVCSGIEIAEQLHNCVTSASNCLFTTLLNRYWITCKTFFFRHCLLAPAIYHLASQLINQKQGIKLRNHYTVGREPFIRAFRVFCKPHSYKWPSSRLI